jgi:hypothetical protein
MERDKIDSAAALISSNPDLVTFHLGRYFCSFSDASMGAANGFTGRFFEEYSQKSERNRFTPWDMLAVSSLGVEIPAEYVAYLLLGRASKEINFVSLLRECNTEIDASDSWLVEPVEGWTALKRLYAALTTLSDMGPVKTSKLMAAKFPNHVPISDKRVNNMLGFQYRRGTSWWATVRDFLKIPGVKEGLEGVLIHPKAPKVGLLRRLDVVLWMEDRWNESYLQLSDFVVQARDPATALASLVGTEQPKRVALARWCDFQRELHLRDELSHSHFERLEAIGFWQRTVD